MYKTRSFGNIARMESAQLIVHTKKGYNGDLEIITINEKPYGEA